MEWLLVLVVEREMFVIEGQEGGITFRRVRCYDDMDYVGSIMLLLKAPDLLQAARIGSSNMKQVTVCATPHLGLSRG